jgi:glucose dehydrogenase
MLRHKPLKQFTPNSRKVQSMERARGAGLLAGLSAVLLIVLSGCTPTTATQEDTAEARATMLPGTVGELPQIPPEVADHAGDWPLGNRDYGNTRATFDAAITAENVDTLGVAWAFEILANGAWGGAAGNPLIAGDTVYFQDLAANTHAIDLHTGEEIWQKRYDNELVGPGGPGLGYGRVYIVNRVDQFAALDLATGEELWRYTTDSMRPSGAIQPSAFDGRVYITSQAGVGGAGEEAYRGYQGGVSGFAFALNPETGEPLWEWQAVEEGFWGNPDVNSGGGMWYPPAIDIERGLTFWGTGNPAPFAGTAEFPNASSRPGPNLYTDSLVALDHATGEMAWYYQVTPHDLFDHDFQASPILATVAAAGEERDIVIGGGKSGRILAFDRTTGERLWETAVGKHENDDLDEVPPGETVWVYPGVWGGVETPMAYAEGVVYALVTNLPTPYHATMWDAKDGTEAVHRAEGGTLLENGTAEVNALDAATGEILWRYELDRVAFAAVTVVNDLLFTATLDGEIMALRREDGEPVWRFQAPGGINAWPAVAGDTIVWPIGIGSKPVLLALRLDAEGGPLPTPEPQRTPVSGLTDQ